MKRGALFLLMMAGLLVAGSSTAFSEDRFDRFEQKLDEILKENKALKERIKVLEENNRLDGVKAAPQNEPDVINEIEVFKKDTRKLEERIDLIEMEREEETFESSKKVKISGYADFEAHATDQEGQNSKFKPRHFSLFFSKEIQKKWKFFSEMEYENAPLLSAENRTDTLDVAQGKLFLEQMYISYNGALDWDVTLGRFLTPAGIWLTYHYYPYVPTQQRPLHIRLIFPQVSDGVQVRNTFQLTNSTLDTHLYIANGTGNGGREDENENKGIGARLNLSTDYLNGLQVGTSLYSEKDNDDVWRDSYGAHLKLNFGFAELQSEYAIRVNRPGNSNEYNNLGYYLQLTHDIHKWTVAGRYDWYNSDDSQPDNSQFRYTAALNYHFAYNVIGKAEYNRNEFDSPATRDYNEFILSLAIAIGEL